MSRKKKLTGHEAWEAAFAAVDHSPLLESLGVALEPENLRLALTHRSFANENGHLPNNERLEFLGDAVLGLSVAAKLYVTYPYCEVESGRDDQNRAGDKPRAQAEDEGGGKAQAPVAVDARVVGLGQAMEDCPRDDQEGGGKAAQHSESRSDSAQIS